MFFNEKMHHFFHQLFIAFWLHFGRLLGLFYIKKPPSDDKCDLIKEASRLHESLIFDDWVPQNPSKMPFKINQKICAFFMEN